MSLVDSSKGPLPFRWAAVEGLVLLLGMISVGCSTPSKQTTEGIYLLC